MDVNGFRRRSQVSWSEKADQRVKEESHLGSSDGAEIRQWAHRWWTTGPFAHDTKVLLYFLPFQTEDVEWFHVFTPIMLHSSPVFPVLFWMSVAPGLIWQHSSFSPVLTLPPLMCSMCAVNRHRLPLCRVTLFHIFPFMFPPVVSHRLTIVFFYNSYWTLDSLKSPLPFMNLPLVLAFSVKVWAVSVASAYNIELDPTSPRGRDLVPNYGAHGIFIVQWKEKLHHHRPAQSRFYSPT